MRYLSLFLILVLLHSCVLYPKYQRPELEMPESWRVTNDESTTAINIRWWESFNDPVLNLLIAEALESNKDLKIATARIAEFRAQLGISESELYPQLGAQFSYSRQRVSQTLPGVGSLSLEAPEVDQGEGGIELPELPSVSPYSNNYLTLLTASYEVDLWGRIHSHVQASLEDLWASVEARRTVILSVVTSVASAYMQLRQFDQQLVVSRQTAKSRKESLDLAINRFEEGLTSELEVKQAASEWDQALLQLIQYQTDIQQQENLISVLIGHPPTSLKRGLPVDGWELPLQVPVGLPSNILFQRPDVVEAEKRLKAANFRIGEARALFFPTFSLTGNYGYQSAELLELFTNPSRTWQWTLNLLHPLFTGWRITNLVELAKARKEGALYQYQQTVLTALQEVNDALIAHKNSKLRLEVEYDNVRDLKDYLHLGTLQYENGLVDYLNVLDAQRRLFQAQLSLAQAQTSVFLTLVNIYKALGGGWVIDAECTFENSSQKM